jgi:hypothetical protein
LFTATNTERLLAAGEQGKSATATAAEVATKVKDTVVGAAQNAYDAVAGKK